MKIDWTVSCCWTDWRIGIGVWWEPGVVGMRFYLGPLDAMIQRGNYRGTVDPEADLAQGRRE